MRTERKETEKEKKSFRENDKSLEKEVREEKEKEKVSSLYVQWRELR